MNSNLYNFESLAALSENEKKLIRKAAVVYANRHLLPREKRIIAEQCVRNIQEEMRKHNVKR